MGVASNSVCASTSRLNVLLRLTCLVALATGAVGCQIGAPTVSNRALLAHLPGVDFSGLKEIEKVDSVNASCSIPDHWHTVKPETSALYSHQQWKAPSGYTGVGIVHARLPLPLSAKSLLWFAKLEYSKKTNNSTGNSLGEWTDELGRPWFEAENEKYHVRGYAVTEGFQAWIVYYGYKVQFPPNAAELKVAGRCVETVVPGNTPVKKTAVADSR